MTDEGLDISYLDNQIKDLARNTGAELKRLGLVSVTAESCTGGLVSAALTSVPGSSEWFDRAFITYSNEAKMEMLGVREGTLKKYGAVSEETVREMSLGALASSRGDIAVSLSGIAGPGGGTPDKPVGTIWLAWAFRGEIFHTCRIRFAGSRELVRKRAVIQALTGIYNFCKDKSDNRGEDKK
ncbi:CinA family protein [Succinimonas amylolytica]|uniref:CinA family protein n=1 Tax=Succinimonas amylolytica TaxID=83769 RepID=UPI0023A91355